MLRDALGRIVKSTPAVVEEDQAKSDGQGVPADADPVLGEYRKQADALATALAAVKAVQQDIGSTTEARETALGTRQKLIDTWFQNENETCIEELSRLSSRGDPSWRRNATRLARAEAELKAAMATFAISFNSLFLTLRTHLVRDAAARIAAMIHPSVRQISGATVTEIARMEEAVINLDPLAIRVEAGAAMFDSILPPENIERDAERSLPKAEPLLATAQQHLERGFVPPPAFSLEKWRASLESGCSCRSLKSFGPGICLVKNEASSHDIGR